MKFGKPQGWVPALLFVSLVSAVPPLTGCAGGITAEDACRILNCDTLFFVESLFADLNADDMHDDTDHDDMDMGDDDMQGADDMHDDGDMHDGDEEPEDEHEEGDDEHDE